MNLDVNVCWIELAQHGGFAGARLRVPLRSGAAAGQQQQRILGASAVRASGVVLPTGTSRGHRRGRTSVGEKSTLVVPLRCAGFGCTATECRRASIDVGVVADAGDVARLTARRVPAECRTRLRASSSCAKHFAAAPGFGHQAEDAKVGQSLHPAPRATFLRTPIPPFGVDERPFLLAPTRRGQHRSRKLRGFRRVIHVLHDQKIEPAQNVAGIRSD